VCRLGNLPDLNQSNSFVSNTLRSWVSSTVSKYQFDGIRVDTVPEVCLCVCVCLSVYVYVVYVCVLCVVCVYI